MKWWTAFFAALMVLVSLNAEAARLGGGRSMGRQSGNVTQREAAPPSAPAVNQRPAPAPAQAPAPVPQRRPWGAMLGGLAAGLGLAWLAHSMGFGEGFGNVLLVIGALLVPWMVLRYFLQSRRVSPAPYAYGGDGMGTAARTPYRPENVGNDASARPWEQQGAPFQAATANGGSMIGSALAGSQAWGVPAGFDTEGFLRAAKANFITLQAAWDKSDISSLRAMMTDSMLAEIRTQLSDREAHTGTQPNHTEVLAIEAHLLGIEELADEYMASVEFTGMIREEPGASPSPFREVWNMTKPKAGGGWLVAGVQALQ